ncbi:MAG TPA: ABC transporter substrate-binding protein [Gemmatimonadota bacterium]|nr:ABC transporter substrate-binding protein [Gemmatimonadota bacterium]
MERRVLVLILAATLAACGGGGGDAGETGGAEATPADGDMLIVGVPSDFDTLFPPSSNSANAGWAYGQVYWYLMRANPDFVTFRPGLADSFRFSEDSLQVTFFIHPQVTWHDGHPFTAEDVVFAHEVCKAPEINFSAVSWLDHITSVEAIDSLTVRYTFDEPYMYQVMDANVCYPLPKHILGDVAMADMPNHPVARSPIGNGPFRFVSWDAGQEIVLEANPDFILGRPHLNRVTYRIIPDNTNLATEIQNGNIDAWPTFPETFYPQFESDPDLQIFSVPGRRYSYVAYNTQDPLFSDRRVRQALTLAIDRGRLVEALLFGQGTIGTQPMISTIWAHDPTIQPYPFDPDSARALLAAAGWSDTNGDGTLDKDGRPFSFQLATNVDNQLRVDIVTIIQQQLKDLGIEVRANTLEFNTFIEQLLAKDFQAAVSGWNVGIKAELTPTFGRGELFNFVSADNAGLDSLVKAAEVERDRAKAMEMWSEAQRIIVDEAYYTFLFQQNDLLVVDRRFHDVEPDAYSWDSHLEKWFVPEGQQKYDVPIGSAPVARATEGASGVAGR